MTEQKAFFYKMYSSISLNTLKKVARIFNIGKLTVKTLDEKQ